MNILLLLLVLLAIYLFFRWWRNTRAATTPDTPTADWSEWQARLEAHSLPCLKIDLLNQQPSTPWQSRFGGTPWWPRGREWPRDHAGKPLHLLAQINFSETENKLPGYPQQGLLQFFIASGDNWGMDIVDRNRSLEEYLAKPRNFCVIYHEQPDEDAPGQPPPDAADIDPDLPFSGESALRLRLEEDIATIHDYRFGNITRDLGEADEAIIEHVLEITGDSPVHQAGGYARFSQEDPRALQAGEPEWLLLLQVDTDGNDHIKIMWGDAGIGSFFIRRDDLEKLDFSRVWYSWDCY